MKIIVYGTGKFYEEHKHMLPLNAEILAFADSFVENTTAYTKEKFEEKEIVSLEDLQSLNYDEIWICTDVGMAAWEIYKGLINSGISTKKIKMLYRECTKKLWTYVATKDGLGYISKIDNIEFEEKTYTEFLSYEILVDDEYGMPIKEDRYVVVDIGMNVAISSLYYANRAECVKVYAYEPFKDTFNRGIANIDRNPHLAGKIKAFNYALSDSEYCKRINPVIEESGQRSILSSKQISGETEYEIQCRIAYNELQKIRSENENLPLLLNIDTEGSEYQILRNLDVNNGFEHVIGIAMEWHGNPTELFDILARNNFRWWIKRISNETGLIYATKG